jgi:hypothetical protein
MIDPIETREKYLSADICLSIDSGNITNIVVMMACNVLNSVIPSPGSPVISFDIPKLLQHITKSFVTIE